MASRGSRRRGGGVDGGKADRYSESDLKQRCEEPCGDLPGLINLHSEGGKYAQSEMER